MVVTSSVANKLIRQLEEEKEYWTNKEDTSSTYIATVNETPIVPDYDYSEVKSKIAEIDEKIVTLKHAINATNVSTVINVGDREVTIDQILVEMAQKNKRKNKLEQLRSKQPIARVTPDYFRGSASRDPEYEYINYDLEQVNRDFECVSKEIVDMQLALDRHNQTFEFEVAI